MKNNIKLTIFVIICVIALYFSKVKYNDHSLKKSILGCVIAQKNKSKNMTHEEARIYCENKIKKKLSK